MRRSPEGFRGIKGLRRRGFNSYEFTAEGRTVSIARYGKFGRRWRVVWPNSDGSLRKTPVQFSSLKDACGAVTMAVTGFL